MTAGSKSDQDSVFRDFLDGPSSSLRRAMRRRPSHQEILGQLLVGRRHEETILFMLVAQVGPVHLGDYVAGPRRTARKRRFAERLVDQPSGTVETSVSQGPFAGPEFAPVLKHPLDRAG